MSIVMLIGYWESKLYYTFAIGARQPSFPEFNLWRRPAEKEDLSWY